MVDWTDGNEVDGHAVRNPDWMEEQLDLVSGLLGETTGFAAETDEQFDRIFELLSENPEFTEEMRAALKLAQDGGHPEYSWNPSEDLHEDPDHPSEQALKLMSERASGAALWPAACILRSGKSTRPGFVLDRFGRKPNCNRYPPVGNTLDAFLDRCAKSACEGVLFGG